MVHFRLYKREFGSVKVKSKSKSIIQSPNKVRRSKMTLNYANRVIPSHNRIHSESIVMHRAPSMSTNNSSLKLPSLRSPKEIEKRFNYSERSDKYQHQASLQTKLRQDISGLSDDISQSMRDLKQIQKYNERFKSRRIAVEIDKGSHLSFRDHNSISMWDFRG